MVPSPDDPRPVLLYDGDCGFCRWSVAKVVAWDRRGRLRTAAIQSAEGQRLLTDLPEPLRLDSFHLAEPGGQVRSAGAAAAPLLELLPGGRPPALLMRTFPGLTERAYRAVAARRDRLGHRLRR